MRKHGLRLLICALLSVGTISFLYAASPNWKPTLTVRYSSSFQITTPDQDYATRRPITDRDRGLIDYYRSGNIKPIFETHFAINGDLGRWDVHVDDNAALRSCRSPQSVKLTPEGLILEVMEVIGCNTRWSTGQLVSKDSFGFGYFEASMKIAAIPGVDNAFWITTTDRYEIDVIEAFHPSSVTSAVHQWAPPKGKKKTMVSTRIQVANNLADDFHDYGVLWTPTEMIFAIDGEPYVALLHGGGVRGKAQLRVSNALVPWGNKIPPDPSGNYTTFRGVRVFPLSSGVGE